MKKSVVAIIVVVVIVVVGVLLLATHKSDNSTTSNMSNMNSNQGKDGSGEADTGSSSTNQVNIKGLAFSPTNITVTKGTTVTWTNNDTVTHTVTENDGQSGPNSGDLDSGKSYSFTYNTAGTFKYHCSIHSEMTGTVTVTE